MFLDLAIDATTREAGSAVDAIAMWNSIAATRLELRDSPAAHRLPLRFEIAAPAFHGVYDDEAGELIINRKLADDHQRAVTIAHELGHAFGLPHITGRVSVMSPGNLDIEPTLADRTALVELWGACPGESLALER